MFKKIIFFIFSIFWYSFDLLGQDKVSNQLLDFAIRVIDSGEVWLDISTGELLQIYIDIHVYDGRSVCTTATIFDPFQSYFYFPITEESNAFFQLYFDLVEQFRRRLEAMNNETTTQESMIENYRTIEKGLENTSRTFFKEVERGTNASGMKKWNYKIQHSEF